MTFVNKLKGDDGLPKTVTTISNSKRHLKGQYYRLCGTFTKVRRERYYYGNCKQVYMV